MNACLEGVHSEGQKSRRVRNGKKSQNAFEAVYIRADRVRMELHVAEPHI